jgi:hypothetical protein
MVGLQTVLKLRIGSTVWVRPNCFKCFRATTLFPVVKILFAAYQLVNQARLPENVPNKDKDGNLTYSAQKLWGVENAIYPSR